MGDIISKVEAAAIHGDWMSRHPERYSQAVYSRTEPGFHLPAVRYVEAINLRARLLARMHRAEAQSASLEQVERGCVSPGGDSRSQASGFFTPLV